MGNYISIGNYNILIKSFWFYAFSKFILEYIIESFLPEKTSLFDKHRFPRHGLIQEGFDYLGTFIISIIIFLYEKKNLRTKGELTSTKIEERFNRINSVDSPRTNSGEIERTYSSISQKTNSSAGHRSKSEIDYIYNEFEFKELTQSDYFIIVLLFLCSQATVIYYGLGLRGLDFWMPEILFLCYFTYKMLGIPVYKHKKVAIFIILFVCSLFKILSLGFRFVDDDKGRLFKIYKWIIPLGIIVFITLKCLTSYSVCRIKLFFHLKFILPSKLLIIYGFFGMICCFIISIIPSCISCVDKDEFENINYICNLTKTDSYNNTIYYYESYSIFFNKLWDNDRNNSINFGFLFLFLLKIVLSFGTKFFLLLIVKSLNPEYLVCSSSIHYFLTEICDTLYFLIKNIHHFKLYKFFELMSEFFCFIGIIIYLEIIELKFCDFDHDLKSNIIKRSREDSQNTFMLDDDIGAINSDDNAGTEL